MLETLPLVLFIVLTELTIGSVSVLVFLDWRNEVKRGFLTSYAFIYLVLTGLTYLCQQSFASAPLLNTFKMLDHSWTAYQATPLLIFFLLLIAYSILLVIDRNAGVDGKEKAEKATAQGNTPRTSKVRVLRLISGVGLVIFGLITLFVMAMIYHPLGGPGLGGAALVLGFFAATFALGGVMTAMWLGHWYLVTPALSERPLLFSTTLVLVAIVAQVLFSLFTGFGTAAAMGTAAHVAHTVVAATPTVAPGNGVKPGNAPVITPLSVGAIGWIHILVGFALPFILCVLAWKLVRDRSFQSATGMLYLIMVLVFAGEIMGRALFLIGLS